MKNTTQLSTLALSLITATLLVACGGGSSTSNGMNGGGSSTGDNGDITQMEATQIPYLRTNHANYSEHGSTQAPAAVKDANSKSIIWTISATTEEGATKLAEHIAYMEARLKEDKNPRAFDKIFLMEAYMKFNGYYSTSIEVSSTNVVVTKTANTSCAYDIISAHADVVSGDFFAQGIINIDHSATGDAILASASCDALRSDLTAYIAARKKTMMMN